MGAILTFLACTRSGQEVCVDTGQFIAVNWHDQIQTHSFRKGAFPKNEPSQSLGLWIPKVKAIESMPACDVRSPKNGSSKSCYRLAIEMRDWRSPGWNAFSTRSGLDHCSWQKKASEAQNAVLLRRQLRNVVFVSTQTLLAVLTQHVLGNLRRSLNDDALLYPDRIA